MQLVAARQPVRDVGGLPQSALRRRVSREVARNRDENMPPRFRVGPFVKLTHPGLENLIGVKSRIFTQQRMRQNADDQIRRVAQCEVASDEAGRLVDPVLSIESVQQSGADFVDRRGRIRGFVDLSRQPRRRHVQIPRKIDGDSSMEDRARRFDSVRRQIGGGTDALQPLMHRIAVREYVMRRLPIPMLVRQAEPCDAQRRRVRERAAEIGESGPGGDRGLERGDDRFRIVAQEKLGQLGVLRPLAAITTNREQQRKFSGGSLAQRYEVFRLTPLSRTRPRPAPPPCRR